MKRITKMNSSGFETDLWQWAEETRITSRITQHRCHRTTRRLPLSGALLHRIRAILQLRLTSRH